MERIVAAAGFSLRLTPPRARVGDDLSCCSTNGEFRSERKRHVVIFFNDDNKQVEGTSRRPKTRRKTAALRGFWLRGEKASCFPCFALRWPCSRRVDRTGFALGIRVAGAAGCTSGRYYNGHAAERGASGASWKGQSIEGGRAHLFGGRPNAGSAKGTDGRCVFVYYRTEQYNLLGPSTSQGEPDHTASIGLRTSGERPKTVIALPS